ncbi:hypothetical protein OH77DRAFT_1519192 [Trametes cingulata]|nr:hypothetical protein OH77DRAFT_1519192 [Trametes cingulata]
MSTNDEHSLFPQIHQRSSPLNNNLLVRRDVTPRHWQAPGGRLSTRRARTSPRRRLSTSLAWAPSLPTGVTASSRETRVDQCGEQQQPRTIGLPPPPDRGWGQRIWEARSPSRLWEAAAWRQYITSRSGAPASSIAPHAPFRPVLA